MLEHHGNRKRDEVKILYMAMNERFKPAAGADESKKHMDKHIK